MTTPTSPAPPAIRLPVTAGAVLLAVLYAGWRLSITAPAGVLGVAASSLVFVPFNVAAAWMFFRASGQPRLDPGLRRGLRLIALALLGPALGNVSWFYLSEFRGIDPTASWANLGYFAYYPFALMGLWSLPLAQRTRSELWKFLLDSLTVLVGVAALAWFFMVRPTFAAYGDPVTTAIQLIYPVGDFLVLLSIATIALRGLPRTNRTAMALLLTGLALNILIDFIYSYLYPASEWQGVSWTDLVYVLSNLLLVWAAERFARRPSLLVETPAVAAGELQPFSPLPLLSTAALAVLLAWAALRSWTPVLSPLALLVVLVTGLIALRQALAVRQNVRLLKERAARESEERLAALVRHSSDMIAVVDAGHRIRFSSPAAARILGVAEDGLGGRSISELLHPDDLPAGESFLDDLLLRPGETGMIAWRMRHADGSWRSLEAVGTNLLREPTVAGLVLNMRDVTERERLAEELRQAQKMEALGRLAGGMAHDFNNLLTTILASADLALREIPPNDPATRDLEAIHHAATRAGSLTGQLLAFSRKQVVEPRRIDLGQVAADTSRLLERLLGEQIHLVVSAEPGLSPVLADRNQLEQILLNLAVNARDAMPGGGTLYLTVQSLELEQPIATRFHELPPGTYVMLEVTDSGQGMDEPTLERIFEPFFTTKEPGKGTGLGLASVYGIVRQNGWGITVESRPAEGSCFRIYVPRAEGEPTPEPAAAPVRDTRETGTILLVEDEPSLLDVARRILQLQGYTVVPAANAEAASRLAAGMEGTIDLLLTDVIMPGDSGAVLAGRLRRHRPQLRVLFMSGYTGDELGAHGILESSAALLQKPFTARELTDRVRAALGAPPVPIPS